MLQMKKIKFGINRTIKDKKINNINQVIVFLFGDFETSNE
jgi:hypothetical protein